MGHPSEEPGYYESEWRRPDLIRRPNGRDPMGNLAAAEVQGRDGASDVSERGSLTHLEGRENWHPLPPEGDGSRISLGELERALKTADPAAWLVAPRIVRRVVRHQRGLSLFGLSVPHRKSATLSARQAEEIVERHELGLPDNATLPPTLILIARPDLPDLVGAERGEVLTKLWRLLFHTHIHISMESLVEEGVLTQAELRARIDQIGQAEFDEVRAVLRHENFLIDTRDLARVYVEFAAVYLELRHFAPGLLSRYFPTLRDLARVDEVLAADVDDATLLARTRLPGAPDLPSVSTTDSLEFEIEPDETEVVEEEPEPAIAPVGRSRSLIRQADRARAVGNLVRSAIARERAARLAGPSRAVRLQDAARSDLGQLCECLAPALGLDEAERRHWQRTLPLLLPSASRGIRSHSARLLYDLQKVAVDFGRDIYAVDLVEWAVSRGHRPIKRLLPNQREVLMIKHLRAAARRLSKVRLAEVDRERLAHLLNEAQDRLERTLRMRFRPEITTTLETTGWNPRNLPERVALEKLTEELLDRVVSRGFLTMGDLRDAVSRSHLKLPDLASLREFFRGDRLLRTDAALSISLDGVYRRGEVYLRWLQRFSSLFFGTRAGRLSTLYLALPFGGAFVVLEVIQHVAEFVAKWRGSKPVHLFNGLSYMHDIPPFAILGLFLVGMINLPGFRREVLQGLRAFGIGLRRLFIEMPTWLMERPFFRGIVESRAFTVFWRWGLKPMLFAGATVLVLPSVGADPHDTLWLGAVVFLVVGLVLNSRFGRDLEEVVTEQAVRVWHRLQADLIPGLFRLIMEFFNRLLEGVERLLYTIDEWLRFKSGQGRISLASKALLGLVAFFVTYLIRFCVILLVEPQINPIKHFPVVTVSHKIIAPAMLALPGLLTAAPWYLSKVSANAIAGAAQFLLPGIFGFLVWEFKENWRLYEANRPRSLRPVAIGHHGETMTRLLRRASIPAPCRNCSSGCGGPSERPCDAPAQLARSASTVRRCTTSRRRCVTSSSVTS